jgi:glycosyltransferase involved in cell wall biosynthesis
MRILLLTQLFQPESNFKGLPFAKALKNMGHDVEVLTGFPNYPGGKVYPGYSIRFYQKDVMDGIKVHRAPLYPSHDKSALRRIFNYISFSLSAFLLGPWLVKKPDVIYVYNLVTLAPTAFLLRFFFGSKVIIDVLDLWPDSVVSSNMLNNKAALQVLGSICNTAYLKADKLVVPTQGIKSALIDRGMQAEKIEIIYNWCDETCIRKESSPPNSEKDIGFSSKFVVLYAGAMGVVQGLDTLLDCAEICKRELPDVRFILIGDGADRERLEKTAKSMNLDNVTFLPRRSPEAMGEVFALADALLVHLQDDPLFRITIPSKTQAYLYMGKPLIMAMLGDAAELVRQAGAGVICEPGNPRAMTDALRTLHTLNKDKRCEMGQAGRRYYMEHLSFAEGVNKFENIMMSLIQNNKE